MTAAQLTLRTVDRRARAYRNTVVPIAAIFLATSGLALGFRSWRALAGYALILPAPGLFLWADGRILRQWQQTMLEKWVAGELDLPQVERALSAYRSAPQSVLQSMLMTLDETRRYTAGDRKIAARVLQQAHRQERQMLLNSGGLLGVAVSIGAAAWLRSWVALLVAVAGVATVIVCARRR